MYTGAPRQTLNSDGELSFEEDTLREVDVNRQEVLAEMAQELKERSIMEGMDELIKRCYGDSKARGWHDHGTNIPEKIALIHSEISEALEGDRKDLMDDKLPEFKQLVVELGDAIIRICDLVGYLQSQALDVQTKKELDLSKAIVDKLNFNKIRKDHNKEEREKAGGKKY